MTFMTSQESLSNKCLKKEFEEDDYDNAVNSAMLDLFAEEEPQSKESLSSFEKQQKSIKRKLPGWKQNGGR